MADGANQDNWRLELLLDGLEIPASAYAKADQRYKDLATWFGRPESHSGKFAPHIYPQGSFRLGTVVRPLLAGEEYDLDIGCRLMSGISKRTHTQQQLKDLVGRDLATYRTARNVSDEIEEKRRCWRLAYQDEVAFHMDVVPSIPEEANVRAYLTESIKSRGADATLANQVAQHAGAITDNTNLNYKVISTDWRVSNSEGYAIWFESRMRLAQALLEQKAALAKVRFTELPAQKWDSPLQKAIKILKRHRDFTYRTNPESKPISIIITTLAAEAYAGETELFTALSGILTRMDHNLRPNAPRVPNPVNPSEDFADKWSEQKYAHLHLEDNFHRWLAQARADFRAIADSTNPDVLLEQARLGFGIELSKSRVDDVFQNQRTPMRLKEPVVVASASKPWFSE